MTISIANTLITNTFEYWRSRTNELAYAMSSNTVTTGGSPAVGNAYVTGLFFANNLNSNTLSVTGASTFSNTLGITGAGTFSNTLSVTGAATFSNTTTYTGTATFSNTTTHTGAATFANTLGATGAVTLANTLAVTGFTTFSNNVGIGAAPSSSTLLRVYNQLNTGTSTDSATLTVKSDNRFATIEVDANATRAGSYLFKTTGTEAGRLYYDSDENYLSFSVNGSVFSTAERMRIDSNGNLGIGNTAPNAKLQVTGAANVSGILTVGGALALTGAAILSNTVSATGAVTLANTLGVTGPATLSNTLSVTSNTSLSNVTISASLSVTGNVYLGTTAVINSSYYTGTASNANTLGGLAPTSYVNTTTIHASAGSQDVTIGGAYNSLTAVLATTGVGAATYGDSASFPVITVDAKGRLTSVTTQPVNSSVSTLSVNNALFLVGFSGNNFVQNTDSRTLSGNLVFSSPLEANTTNAAIIISGGVIISKRLYANATTATAYFNNVATLGVEVTSTVDSTSITTGSIITDGGVGIAKNLYANGSGATAYFTSANVTGLLTANGGTFNGVFANSTGQDVIISGTSSASLAANLVTMQGLTGGTYGSASNIPTITIDTKGRINAISLSAVSIPTGVVNTSGNFTIAGNLVFSSTLEANTTNAAIIIAGGVIVNKNIYANLVSSTSYFNNVAAIGIGVTSTVDSTSTATGALRVSGGVGIAKNLYANGSGTGTYLNNANVAGTLGVVGASTLGSTLNVTGLTTLSANLVMGGNFITSPILKGYSEYANTNTGATASYNLDLSLTNIFTMTANQATNPTTITFSNPPATGILRTFTVIINQGAAGSRTVTWPNTVKWSYGDTPVLSTTISSRDVFTLMTFDGGTTYLAAYSMANVAS
jgi:hypothetical protein